MKRTHPTTGPSAHDIQPILEVANMETVTVETEEEDEDHPLIVEPSTSKLMMATYKSRQVHSHMTFKGTQGPQKLRQVFDSQNEDRTDLARRLSEINHDHMSMICTTRSFLCVMCRSNRVGRTIPLPVEKHELTSWLDILEPPFLVRQSIEECMLAGLPQYLCTLHMRDGVPYDYLKSIKEARPSRYKSNRPRLDLEFSRVADRMDWNFTRRTYGGHDEELVYKVEDLFDPNKKRSARSTEGTRTVVHSTFSGFNYLALPAATVLQKRNEDILRETRLPPSTTRYSSSTRPIVPSKRPSNGLILSTPIKSEPEEASVVIRGSTQSEEPGVSRKRPCVDRILCEKPIKTQEDEIRDNLVEVSIVVEPTFVIKQETE